MGGLITIFLAINALSIAAFFVELSITHFFTPKNESTNADLQVDSCVETIDFSHAFQCDDNAAAVDAFRQLHQRLVRQELVALSNVADSTDLHENHNFEIEFKIHVQLKKLK